MIKKTIRIINRWIEYIIFVLGVSMTTIVAIQVFCRYVLNQSLFWSEELARFLLIWLSFLGACCAYYRQANPGVDFLYSKLSASLKKICSILTHLASMVLFLIMIVYGIQFAYFVRLQISPALQIPKWTIMAIIPFCGSVLMIYAVNFLLTEIKGDTDDC